MIKSLNYAQVVRKFKIPFYSANDLINYREAIYVRLKLDGSKHFFGEISPLKGFSKETFGDCITQLQSIKPIFDNLSQFTNLTELNTFVDSLDLYPSVRFGIEQALLYANLSKLNFNTSLLFSLGNKKKVLLNSVIGAANKNEVLDKFDHLAKQGYSVIKIKLGRNDFEDDLELMQQLNQKYGNKIKLRIDLNGSWNQSNAESYLKQLSEFNIEYIEQPVMEYDLLCKLAELNILPIAANESADSIESIKKIVEDGIIKNIVIKPMMIGGILPLLMLNQSEFSANTHFIISSMFETFIGMNYNYLGASLLDNGLAHGLDTADFLLDNYHDPAISHEPPYIVVKQNEYPPEFNPGNMRWK